MIPMVADLLPHAAPMVLLDEVISWQKGEVITAVMITDNSPFFHLNFGVPAHVGLEYMAQACGVYAGLQAHEHGLPVRMGFLLGTRNFSAINQWFTKGSRLIVSARETLRQDTMGVFNCTIALENKEVAHAQLTVYQPDEADPIFLKAIG